MTGCAFRIFSVSILFLACVSSLAAGGRIPVYAPCTISTGGSFYLTSDVEGDILISASGVDLDLNGLKVNGNLYVNGSGLHSVYIKNGKVTLNLSCSMVNGLGLGRVDADMIHVGQDCENISIDGCSATTISVFGNNSRIAGNRANKMELQGQGHIVESNVLKGSDYYGISLLNASGCLISGNTVTQAVSDGINFAISSSNFVSGNSVTGNSGWGIRMNLGSNGNKIHENSVATNGNSSVVTGGIKVENSSWNDISGNTVSLNRYGEGIYLDSSSSGNNLSRNTVSGNGTAGATGYSGIMIMGSGNTVDWNVSSGNGAGGSGWGIGCPAAGNVLSYNRTPGNSTGGIFCGAGSTLVFYDSAQTAPTNF